MTLIKPIETYYNNHRFRSRLEARWAVFFDALELRWEYEPEGYELPNGIYYLPDFKLWTPQLQYSWVEIKPFNTTADSKFEAFKSALREMDDKSLGHPQRECYPRLISGTPLQWLEKELRSRTDVPPVCPRCGLFSYIDYCDLEEDTIVVFCQDCDWETPCGGENLVEHNGVLGASWRPHKGALIVESSEMGKFLQRVRRAAQKAQHVRFEHGENGGFE